MSRLFADTGRKTLLRCSPSPAVVAGAIKTPAVGASSIETPKALGVVVYPTRNISVSQNSLGRRTFWEKMKYRSRKPRSLGRAPTKLELVDPDPTLDDEEEKLLAEWKNQYEVDMTHCYDLMKERAVLDNLDTGAEKVWIQEEKRHHANMMKINDEWNKQVAFSRETVYTDQVREEEAALRSSTASFIEAQAARRQEVMAYVDRLQAEAASFVTLDNLEEKVGEALDADVVNYNFAITRTGAVIKEKKNSTLLNS